jgi:hypothetical protein
MDSKGYMMVLISRSYPEYKVRFVGKWADCVDEECDLRAGHVFRCFKYIDKPLSKSANVCAST